MKKDELLIQDSKFYLVAASKVGMILEESRRADVQINYGGGSYTDGKTIVIGTPEFVIDEHPKYEECSKKAGIEFNYMEVWTMREALLLHEASHILFSSFSEFKNLQEWAIEEFKSLKTKLSPNAEKLYDKVVAGMVARFANAIEDGRVERFMANKYPGSAKYLRFLNGVFWKMGDTESKSDVANLMMSLCFIATSGIPPMYYSKLKNEVKENVELVWKDVTEITKIASPKLTNNKIKKVIKKLKPFLEKYLLEELENKAMEQALIEMLLEHFDFSNMKPSDTSQEDLDENSITLHIKMPSDSSGEGSGSGSGSGSGDSDDEDSEDSDDSGGSGESGEDSDDKDGEGKGSGDESEDSKDGEDGEESKSDSEKSKEIKEQNKNQKFAKKRKADKLERSNSNEKNSDSSSQNQDNNGQGTSNGNKAPDNVNEDIDEVNKSVKEAIDEAIKESLKSSSKEYDSQIKKAEKNKKPEALSQADIESVRQSYGDDRVEGYKSVKINPSIPAPQEVVKHGRLLRKQLERFFKSEEVHSQSNQHSGRLNKKALRKVGVQDYRIFEKKGKPFEIDACFSVLWDGSGSMSGTKQSESTIACAIMEEAIKPLMPLRIVNFATIGGCVKHYEVKDFDEHDSKNNYAYSYGASRSFNGGNKDGYSIKIATKELINRSESQKILVVLSDGLPSDYYGHTAGRDDVKNAVKEARKNGIKVIPIFFGSNSFINDVYDEYKYMYESNLIACETSEISKALTKEIKKLLIHR